MHLNICEWEWWHFSANEQGSMNQYLLFINRTENSKYLGIHERYRSVFSI